MPDAKDPKQAITVEETTDKRTPQRMAVRLTPVDNSDQPTFANYTSLNVASGMVLLDFGFLEPTVLNAIQRSAKSGGAAGHAEWEARGACRVESGGAAGAVDAARAAAQAGAARRQEAELDGGLFMRFVAPNSSRKWLFAIFCAVTTGACATAEVETHGAKCGAWKDCVGDRRVHREEVALSTGETTVVERTALLDAYHRFPRGEILKARLASGEELHFESCAEPLALDVIRGVFYIVGASYKMHCMREYGFPQTAQKRYVAWRKEGAGWIRLSLEQVPPELKTNLLQQVPDKPQPAPVTSHEKTILLRGVANIGRNEAFWK